ncbi:hypothetical protein BDY19DRAFT_967250 [Irpex rosettiformis]|uniref:Uncharacterized protein n=1 Tax=Irpex rosettiformis TaxID=378272 RepID=A0ACB8TSX0_9APHY|nr:hypothetical protein BDY19DRAFT_967250 [Irpex rosettiformis]
MLITPGKSRASSSAIPAPGRTSGIPTPGRPRSASSIHSNSAAGSSTEDEYISRAFADAIKANDPAHHRASHDLVFPPSSPQFSSHSGRRSVTGRPSSVASSSSIASVHVPRHTKQPPPRSASRTSDVFTRSSSRTGKVFDIGDNVRVESLGFEGILRYLGEIDGKAGTFAGVELNAGFAGKGKNDGSVNGKRYFSCPPVCGIFILSTKLSAPTTGYGNYSRPSSAASARNGRVTPSFPPSAPNGRKTPSHTLINGRVTPVLPSGRITPSAFTTRSTPATVIPSTRTRATAVTRNNPIPTKAKAPESIITPGSRASKYVGMTAKQLSNTRTGATSPAGKSVGSPTSFGLSSPPRSANLTSPSRSRTLSGPFTPRAGRTQSVGVGTPAGTPTRTRTGPGTPRARLPSSVSMPPPPSPSSSLTSRAVSLNDPTTRSDIDLMANSKVIQDMIGNLMTNKSPSSRPPSSASVTSSLFAEQQLHLQNERLQARFDALEDENKRIRASLNFAESSVTTMTTRLATATETSEMSTSRIAELESLLRTAERTADERDSAIATLEQTAKEAIANVEKAEVDWNTRVRDMQSQLDEKEQFIIRLKDLIETKEGLQSENDAVLAAKDTEIALLESRVQKAYTELEEERRDLSGQVDELRKAGQETIALYEERLSAADARRYELEDQLASAEEQLRIQARPISPAAMARQAVSAAEIDNEALKEQIQHLQKKLTSLEDALEDAQVSAEKEELAIHERAIRYKEREDAVRKELLECQDELQRVSKSEETARVRIEEIEEALRENTVALENARAEIEGLRAEVTDLEGIAADAGSPSKASNRSIAPLTGDYELLKAEKQGIERIRIEQEAELEKLRVTCITLRQSLDEQNSELEAARKKLNREVSVNGLQDSSMSTSASSKELIALKDDLKGYKEEIKGHKHIIQELQKELGKENQRSKVLESENKLLVTEIAQLREVYLNTVLSSRDFNDVLQDMKKLEDTFEQTLVREEQELDTEAGTTTEGDNTTLRKSMKDLKAKYEAEIDQIRRIMSDTEMKNARTVHDLNKEIGELENLVETKIYREDELESEIERLKERLAKSQKKSSKTGLPEDSRSSVASMSTQPFPSQPFPVRVQKFSDSDKTDSVSGEDVCEICERPGHDIFTCDLLKDERPLSTPDLGGMKPLGGDEELLLCEDCEERGHTAANCPHSMDVF